MINYEQKGEVLSLTAPVGGVTSGDPVLMSDLLTVPQADAAAGETFAAMVVGVFEITKLAADVMAEGDMLFWDNANTRLTTTALGNLLVGACVEAAGNGIVIVKCRLDGVVRS